jgi:hypothetical protein
MPLLRLVAIEFALARLAWALHKFDCQIAHIAAIG